IVKLLLKYGADPNMKNGSGSTPLDMAKTKQNNDEIIKLLEEAQNTALHIAIANGDLSKAKLLIKQGVDVNKQDKYGNTPLHFAVFNNYKDMVELLLKAKADVN